MGSAINGSVLYNRDKTELLHCPEDIDTERFVIPDTVTYINDHAFDGCYKLKEIVIPSSVEYIGFSAFAHCTSLIHV